MPAEDGLLEIGVRRFGHNYQQIRMALIPAHLVYDIMARYRLNNTSVSEKQTSARLWTFEAESLFILGIQRHGADYRKIRYALLPKHSVPDLEAMHRALFRKYGAQVFQVRKDSACICKTHAGLPLATSVLQDGTGMYLS